jgi:hypothetical protein
MKLSILLASVLIPALSQAALVCQQISPSDDGKVYSAIIGTRSAVVKANGVALPKMKIRAAKPSPGGDQASTTYFSDGLTNGNSVVISSGLTGMTAEIYQAGFSGSVLIATLNQCSYR